MKEGIVIVDLDGTLLDYSRRSHAVYSKIVKNVEMKISEYVGNRNLGYSNWELAKENDEWKNKTYDNFTSAWIAQIEEREYLLFDSVISGAIPWLTNISTKYRVVLCTARRNQTNLTWQLQELGLVGLFSEIIVTESKRTKLEALASIVENSRFAIMIGDTVSDYRTGTSLKIETVLVRTGLQNYDEIGLDKSMRIVNSIVDVKLESV